LWHYLPARDAQFKTDNIMDGCDTAAKAISKYSKYIPWEAASPALGSPP
jgi:hypothetical protein